MSADAAVKKAAWESLQLAAREYTAAPHAQTATNLVEAACEVAQAKGWREPRAAPAAGDVCLPNFGRNKGQPISGTETKDLEWYAGALRKSIDDPSKERWVTENQSLLDAITDELERR